MCHKNIDNIYDLNLFFKLRSEVSFIFFIQYKCGLSTTKTFFSDVLALFFLNACGHNALLISLLLLCMKNKLEMHGLNQKKHVQDLIVSRNNI